MGRNADQITKAYEEKIRGFPYVFCHYKKFNYDIVKILALVQFSLANDWRIIVESL